MDPPTIRLSPMPERRERAWLALIALVAFGIYAIASLVRYGNLHSGVDLAIFGQAIWHYSHFQAPVSTIKGENILGDHFHPILALLAPLYWIWQDPRTLLLAQAALVAASVVPVFLFVRPRLPPLAAWLFCAAYLGFWGLGVGVAFDFHELAFAPLLIGVALVAVDRDRMGWAWAACLALLAVKEDMALVVAFIGIWLLLRRRWGHGALLTILGLGVYELVTALVIPHFAADHHYAYWSYSELGRTPLGALWGLLKAPWKLVTVSLTPATKAATLVALFAPFAFLSLGSPIIVVAVPLLAERFLATNPNYWGMHYQYSMAIAPVLALAAADGGCRLLARGQPGPRSARVLIAVAGVLLIVNLSVSRLASHDSALALVTGTESGFTATQQAAAEGALSAVPAGAAVAAPANLLGHLADRPRLESLIPTQVASAEYLIVDVLQPSCCEEASGAALIGQTVDQQLAQFTPVYYRAGWLVAVRSAPEDARSGVLVPVAAPAATAANRAAEAWVHRVFDTIGAVHGCAAAPTARGSLCFAARRAGFGRATRRLDRALSAEAGSARGGCAALLGETEAAVTRVAAAVRGLTGAESVAVAARRFMGLEAYEQADDPIGLLERYAILCSPRAR